MKGKREMEKYPISKTKLYDELKRRGLTPSEASKEIGFGPEYISNAACVGEMSARGALYLKKFFNITPEDYRPDLLDMVDATVPETPERIPADAIRTAAETFARVLVEQYRETYRQTLIEAITEGLKERGL